MRLNNNSETAGDDNFTKVMSSIGIYIEKCQRVTQVSGNVRLMECLDLWISLSTQL